MKRPRLVLAATCIAAATVLGWLAAQAVTAGAARAKAAKAGKAAPAAQPSDSQGRLPDTVTTGPLPANRVLLRVDLRSKGQAAAKEATEWDGSLSVAGARLAGLRSWSGDPRDVIEGTSWKVTTRRAIPWNSEQRKRGHEAMPLQDSALLVELADVTEGAELKFDTKQGAFSVRLADVPPGAALPRLGGLARVVRVAPSSIILSAPTEDDFPAAAQAADGTLYVAYVAFTHGKDFRAATGAFAEDPKDISNLSQPTGGDQVMLLRLKGNEWSGPIAVTPAGGDVFRPAVAVDKSGDAWVFWTAKRDGQWDLFARSFKGDIASDELRLTRTPEPDVFAAAATDRDGRAWVAWQAFRGGNSDILAARQDGARFSDPMIVSGSPGNQWTPAVAASTDGQVAVAWDSYQNGNYDVYARVWSGGKWGEPVAVATSLGQEVSPAVTFDPSNRLWIAYEKGLEKWGKDWGALEKNGAVLYSARTVEVRVLEQGRLLRPAAEPDTAFAPAGPRGGKPAAVKLSLPRLAADSKGRIWLACRSSRDLVRVNIGSVWHEFAAYYEGDKWSGEILCSGTDNTLDSRPALVARPGGEVLLIAAADGRAKQAAQLPQWFVQELAKQGQTVEQGKVEKRWPDLVNSELAAVVLGPLASAAAPAKLEPAAAEAPPPMPAELAAEAAAVARARAARAEVGGKTLRLLRGEFHRHTEISSDGAGDGMLMDMWRYGLDAAAHDWIGNGDHDNGGREYPWWITQKTTDLFAVPGAFAPMFSYERSCNYPDGHRNPIFAARGVRCLPRLRAGQGRAMDDLAPEADRPNSPDSLLLYRYLAQFDGICASHTSGTDMGTDWRDWSPKVEPVVEIYQGCRQNYEMPGAPRSNTAENSIGGWRPYGFVSLALKRGYRLGFQSSSDHVSVHISYCNVWAEAFTREAIFAALKARHVYGATDNIIADVRCGDHFMGDEFTLASKPTLAVKLTGTAPLAKVHIIKDGNYVHTAEPNKAEVQFQWTDFAPEPGKTSYYYVRGEQADGELVWASPMWITYKP